MPSTSFTRIAKIDSDDNKVKVKYLLSLDGEIVTRTQVVEDTVLKSVSVQIQDGLDSGDISVPGGSISLVHADVSDQLANNKYIYNIPTSAVASSVNVFFNGNNVIDELVSVSKTQIEFDSTKYIPEAFASGVLIISYIEE